MAAVLLLVIGSGQPLGVPLFLAAAVLASLLIASFVLPQRLARRTGRPVALAATMLFAGVAGAVIGVLSEDCSTWSSACRAQVGLWLVSFMLTVPTCQVVRLVFLGTGRTSRLTLGYLFRLARRVRKAAAAGRR